MNSVHDSRSLLQDFPVGFYQILIHNCVFDPYRNGIYKYLHVKSFPLLLLLSCGGCSCFDRFASLFHLWSLNFFWCVEMVCALSLSLDVVTVCCCWCCCKMCFAFENIVSNMIRFRIIATSNYTICSSYDEYCLILTPFRSFYYSYTVTRSLVVSRRLSVLATAICCFSKTDIENRINSMVDFGQHHSYSNGSVIDKKPNICSIVIVW